MRAVFITEENMDSLDQSKLGGLIQWLSNPENQNHDYQTLKQLSLSSGYSAEEFDAAWTAVHGTNQTVASVPTIPSAPTGVTPTTQDLPELQFIPIVKYSWHILTSQLGSIAKLIFVFGGVSLLFTVIISMIGSAFADTELAFLSNLLSLVLPFVNLLMGLLLNLGLLRVVQNRPETVSQLFSSTRLLWPYFLTSIKVGFRVFVGSLLLFVPGIIQAIKYGFAPLVVVDQNSTSSQAMDVSKQMTEGKKFALFKIFLGFSLLQTVGVLLLGVGLLVTIPLAMIGSLVTYLVVVQQIQRG